MTTARAPRLRLGRCMRLKQARDFNRVRNGGVRMVDGCLIANWLLLDPGASCRLGVVTSRRIGGAVERARARRLLREAFRLTQPALRQPVDMVLVARQSIAGKKLGDVQRDYLRAIGRGGLLKETK
jgi:ribonuclease P protein component